MTSLKEFLKQFENIDPESDVVKLTIFLGDFLLHEPYISNEEYNEISSKANNDGYYKYKNNNPYKKGTRRYEIYEEHNNSGMVAADR